jgi:hypothetical protein
MVARAIDPAFCDIDFNLGVLHLARQVRAAPQSAARRNAVQCSARCKVTHRDATSHGARLHAAVARGRMSGARCITSRRTCRASTPT